MTASARFIPTAPAMRAARRLLAFAALVAGVAGCWSRAEPGARGPDTVIRVENQSSDRLTMYAFRGAARTRLGEVNAYSTTLLVIPRGAVGLGGTLRFVGNALASRRQPVSEEISVSPGDTISMRILP